MCAGVCEKQLKGCVRTCVCVCLCVLQTQLSSNGTSVQLVDDIHGLVVSQGLNLNQERPLFGH